MIGNVSTIANPAPVPGTRLSTVTSANAGTDVAAAPPSVIVTLSGADPSALPATYAPPRPVVPAWTTQSQDAVTTRMAGNYTAVPLAARFAGLGQALLDHFSTGGSDFSQAVSTAGVTGMSGIGMQADVGLTIKTASGATVTVSLDSSGDGLAVNLTSSGPLSDAERAAVSKLSGAFQDAIDGMAAVPPKLDLGGLMGFDPGVLSSVDFTTSTSDGRNPPETIAFHADSASRSLKTSGALGQIDMSVDMSSLAILGNASQRAAAIDSYLQQVDTASSRGHGDPSLMALFKDAFTQLNSAEDGTAALLKTPPRIALSANDHAMLTGLADFHASVTQASSAPNPLRPDEKDGFSYQLSQETQVNGRDSLNRGISQHQHSQLSASYHSALSPGVDLMLTEDPKSQNYLYTQINDSADSQTDIAYHKGKLVQASVTQSASQSTHQSTYVMGKLVADTTLPYSQSTTRDLLGLLKPFEDHGKPMTRQRQAEWDQTLSMIHAEIGLQSDPTRLGK